MIAVGFFSLAFFVPAFLALPMPFQVIILQAGASL